MPTGVIAPWIARRSAVILDSNADLFKLGAQVNWSNAEIADE